MNLTEKIDSYLAEKGKYPTFKPGDKVKDQYGKTPTVDHQDGPQVFMKGDTNKWYHPTKIWKVKEELGPYKNRGYLPSKKG